MNHSFALAPIFQGSLFSGRELLQIQLVRRMQRNFQVLVVFFWVAILLGSDLCGRALHFKLPQASISLSFSISLFPTLLHASPSFFLLHSCFPHRWMARELRGLWLLCAAEWNAVSALHSTMDAPLFICLHLFCFSSLITHWWSFFFPHCSLSCLITSLHQFFFWMCLLYSNFSAFSLLFYCIISVLLSLTKPSFFSYFCSPSINFSSAPLSTLLAPFHSVSSFSVSSLLDFFLFWLNCPYPFFHVSSHPLILPILHTSFSLLLISAFLSLSFFCASPLIVFPLSLSLTSVSLTPVLCLYSFFAFLSPFASLAYTSLASFSSLLLTFLTFRLWLLRHQHLLSDEHFQLIRPRLVHLLPDSNGANRNMLKILSQ